MGFFRKVARKVGGFVRKSGGLRVLSPALNKNVFGRTTRRVARSVVAAKTGGISKRFSGRFSGLTKNLTKGRKLGGALSKITNRLSSRLKPVGRYAAMIKSRNVALPKIDMVLKNASSRLKSKIAGKIAEKVGKIVPRNSVISQSTPRNVARPLVKNKVVRARASSVGKEFKTGFLFDN